MRLVIVCEAHDEATVMAEATRSDLWPSDRVVILSSRRGAPFETGNILNIPLQWAIQHIGSPHWQRKHKIRKAIALTAGLQSARFLRDTGDILTNIEASDPDVIHIRILGRFGHTLGRKCKLQFPGRTVISSTSNNYSHDERVTFWRSYDPSVLVSIVLPVYNGARYLSSSIDSCLAQTHRNFELIVVDDGSVDETSAIINRYVHSDPRIKPIRNERNLGLPESLNKGFRFSSGSFLTWTSADNLYRPNAIEYMAKQLCTFPQLGLVYCSMHHIDERGDFIASLEINPQDSLMRPPLSLNWNNMVRASFMYHREVMDVIGAYRSEYRYVEDYDFFIRVCIRFPSKFFYEPCYFYRWHSGSLTSAHRHKYESLLERLHGEHFGSGNRILVPTADQLIPHALSAGRRNQPSGEPPERCAGEGR
jgi:hypothetical protein